MTSTERASTIVAIKESLRDCIFGSIIYPLAIVNYNDTFESIHINLEKFGGP